jgi:hypothetical protein
VEAGVPITVSVTSSPGNHSLTGTTTRTTDVAGVATFDDLELTGIAGSYTLSFDAGSGWPVATISVTLTSGTPVALAMATQPVGNVQIDTNLTAPPAVKIVDSAGNTVTTDNSTVVTASLVTPPGGVSLVNGSATASSGVATFTNVQVSGGIGTFALDFASTPAYTAVTSSTFTILGIPQNITDCLFGGGDLHHIGGGEPPRWRNLHHRSDPTRRPGPFSGNANSAVVHGEHHQSDRPVDGEHDSRVRSLAHLDVLGWFGNRCRVVRLVGWCGLGELLDHR